MGRTQDVFWRNEHTTTSTGISTIEALREPWICVGGHVGTTNYASGGVAAASGAARSDGAAKNHGGRMKNVFPISAMQQCSKEG